MKLMDAFDLSKEEVQSTIKNIGNRMNLIKFGEALWLIKKIFSVYTV